jgi:NADH dehydrogenase
MIFITGATGFIGRHLLRALKRKGLKARCLVRTPERARICADLGFETVPGNVTDKESLTGTIEGADAVVHLVGIIEERGKQTFQKIHVEGTRNLVDEAKKAGVKHFIYVSALGTEPGSKAKYHRTKAEAEESVRASGMGYSILRPSLVIGRDGGFTNKLQGFIASPVPFIPVPGRGEALYQPIYVRDLVECVVRLLDGPEPPDRVFEIGGPEHLSYNEMVLAMAQVMGVRKGLLHIPLCLMGPLVRVIEKTPFSPVTSEQLMLLEKGSTCKLDSVRQQFGFEPTPYRKALELFISPREQGR